jgi:hypothetical protein
MWETLLVRMFLCEIIHIGMQNSSFIETYLMGPRI